MDGYQTDALCLLLDVDYHSKASVPHVLLLYDGKFVWSTSTFYDHYAWKTVLVGTSR